jgi:hypothetical protein
MGPEKERRKIHRHKKKKQENILKNRRKGKLFLVFVAPVPY